MVKPFVVENLFFDEKSEKLTLIDITGREIVFELEGDCCSSSYFDNDCKLDIKDIMGHTVRLIETRDAGSVESDNDWESILQYMTTITTDKGHFTLSWRNSSNGYYCGWCNVSGNGLDALEKEYDRYA